APRPHHLDLSDFGKPRDRRQEQARIVVGRWWLENTNSGKTGPHRAIQRRTQRRDSSQPEFVNIKQSNFATRPVANARPAGDTKAAVRAFGHRTEMLQTATTSKRECAKWQRSQTEETFAARSDPHCAFTIHQYAERIPKL